MTEDLGPILRGEFEKHNDWNKLAEYVSGRQVQSFRAGFKSGAFHKKSVISQCKRALDKLSEIIAD